MLRYWILHFASLTWILHALYRSFMNKKKVTWNSKYWLWSNIINGCSFFFLSPFSIKDNSYHVTPTSSSYSTQSGPPPQQQASTGPNPLRTQSSSSASTPQSHQQHTEHKMQQQQQQPQQPPQSSQIQVSDERRKHSYCRQSNDHTVQFALASSRPCDRLSHVQYDTFYILKM